MPRCASARATHPSRSSQCPGWTPPRRNVTGDPSPVEATFTEAARYMCWPLHDLRTFLDQRPDLRVTLQRLVSDDLARKLEASLAR
jgi:hypothetical protein